MDHLWHKEMQPSKIVTYLRPVYIAYMIAYVKVMVQLIIWLSFNYICSNTFPIFGWKIIYPLNSYVILIVRSKRPLKHKKLYDIDVRGISNLMSLFLFLLNQYSLWLSIVYSNLNVSFDRNVTQFCKMRYSILNQFQHYDILYIRVMKMVICVYVYHYWYLIMNR